MFHATTIYPTRFDSLYIFGLIYTNSELLILITGKKHSL